MENKIKIEKLRAFKVGKNFQKTCPAWLWAIIEEDVENFYSDYSKMINGIRDEIDKTFDIKYPGYKYEDDNGKLVNNFYHSYYEVILVRKLRKKFKNFFIKRWFITDGLQLGFETIFGTKYEIGFMIKKINALYEI